MDDANTIWSDLDLEEEEDLILLDDDDDADESRTPCSTPLNTTTFTTPTPTTLTTPPLTILTTPPPTTPPTTTLTTTTSATAAGLPATTTTIDSTSGIRGSKKSNHVIPALRRVSGLKFPHRSRSHCESSIQNQMSLKGTAFVLDLSSKTSGEIQQEYLSPNTSLHYQTTDYNPTSLKRRSSDYPLMRLSDDPDHVSPPLTHRRQLSQSPESLDPKQILSQFETFWEPGCLVLDDRHNRISDTHSSTSDVHNMISDHHDRIHGRDSGISNEENGIPNEASGIPNEENGILNLDNTIPNLHHPRPAASASRKLLQFPTMSNGLTAAVTLHEEKEKSFNNLLPWRATTPCSQQNVYSFADSLQTETGRSLLMNSPCPDLLSVERLVRHALDRAQGKKSHQPQSSDAEGKSSAQRAFVTAMNCHQLLTHTRYQRSKHSCHHSNGADSSRAIEPSSRVQVQELGQLSRPFPVSKLQNQSNSRHFCQPQNKLFLKTRLSTTQWGLSPQLKVHQHHRFARSLRSHRNSQSSQSRHPPVVPRRRLLFKSLVRHPYPSKHPSHPIKRHFYNRPVNSVSHLASSHVTLNENPIPCFNRFVPIHAEELPCLSVSPLSERFAGPYLRHTEHSPSVKDGQLENTKCCAPDLENHNGTKHTEFPVMDEGAEETSSQDIETEKRKGPRHLSLWARFFKLGNHHSHAANLEFTDQEQGAITPSLATPSSAFPSRLPWFSVPYRKIPQTSIESYSPRRREQYQGQEEKELPEQEQKNTNDLISCSLTYPSTAPMMQQRLFRLTANGSPTSCTPSTSSSRLSTNRSFTTNEIIPLSPRRSLPVVPKINLQLCAALPSSGIRRHSHCEASTPSPHQVHLGASSQSTPWFSGLQALLSGRRPRHHSENNLDSHRSLCPLDNSTGGSSSRPLDIGDTAGELLGASWHRRHSLPIVALQFNEMNPVY